MNIDDLTYGEIKQLLSMFSSKGDDHFFEIGENYLVRTVTHYFVGRVVSVGDKEVVLVDASWVADTGRFHDALKSGDLDEIEPYMFGEHVIVGRGALIDAVKWGHDLPREQK